MSRVRCSIVDAWCAVAVAIAVLASLPAAMGLATTPERVSHLASQTYDPWRSPPLPSPDVEPERRFDLGGPVTAMLLHEDRDQVVVLVPDSGRLLLLDVDTLAIEQEIVVPTAAVAVTLEEGGRIAHVGVADPASIVHVDLDIGLVVGHTELVGSTSGDLTLDAVSSWRPDVVVAFLAAPDFGQGTLVRVDLPAAPEVPLRIVERGNVGRTMFGIDRHDQVVLATHHPLVVPLTDDGLGPTRRLSDAEGLRMPASDRFHPDAGHVILDGRVFSTDTFEATGLLTDREGVARPGVWDVDGASFLQVGPTWAREVTPSPGDAPGLRHNRCGDAGVRLFAGDVLYVGDGDGLCAEPLPDMLGGVFELQAQYEPADLCAEIFDHAAIVADEPALVVRSGPGVETRPTSALLPAGDYVVRSWDCTIDGPVRYADASNFPPQRAPVIELGPGEVVSLHMSMSDRPKRVRGTVVDDVTAEAVAGVEVLIRDDTGLVDPLIAVTQQDGTYTSGPLLDAHRVTVEFRDPRGRYPDQFSDGATDHDVAEQWWSHEWRSPQLVVDGRLRADVAPVVRPQPARVTEHVVPDQPTSAVRQLGTLSAIVYDEQRDEVVVSMPFDEQLVVLDPRTLDEVRRLPLAGGPSGLALHPEGGAVAVHLASTGEIAVIDHVTGDLLGRRRHGESVSSVRRRPTPLRWPTPDQLVMRGMPDTPASGGVPAVHGMRTGNFDAVGDVIVSADHRLEVEGSEHPWSSQPDARGTVTLSDDASLAVADYAAYDVESLIQSAELEVLGRGVFVDGTRYLGRRVTHPGRERLHLTMDEYDTDSWERTGRTITLPCASGDRFGDFDLVATSDRLIAIYGQDVCSTELRPTEVGTIVGGVVGDQLHTQQIIATEEFCVDLVTTDDLGRVVATTRTRTGQFVLHGAPGDYLVRAWDCRDGHHGEEVLAAVTLRAGEHVDIDAGSYDDTLYQGRNARGQVLDWQTNEPVEGVRVELLSHDGILQRWHAITAADGSFEIPGGEPNTSSRVRLIDPEGRYEERWHRGADSADAATTVGGSRALAWGRLDVMIGVPPDIGLRLVAPDDPLDESGWPGPFVEVRTVGDRPAEVAIDYELVLVDGTANVGTDVDPFRAPPYGFAQTLARGETVSGHWLRLIDDDEPEGPESFELLLRVDGVQVGPSHTFTITENDGWGTAVPDTEPEPEPSPPAIAPPAAESVVRVSGATRYETAVAISRESKPDGADGVVLTTGTDFPDALAAGPAAAAFGVPLLLTAPGELPAVTRDELRRLRPAWVLIAGGPDAIDTSVESTLASLGLSVHRIAGPSRHDTAAALSAATFEPGVRAAVVTVGTSFPDALGGGPLATRFGGPVLLTDRDALPSATLLEIVRLQPERLYVLGGTAAVTDEVVDHLRGLVPDTRRLAGEDRWATSRAIAGEGWTRADTVVVATGESFPDALAGGPLAATQGAPMMLTPGLQLPRETENVLRMWQPERAYVLGGPAAIEESVVSQVAATVR